MATVGLKGIWGLEQLDKTGLATWKLGLILMGIAAPEPAGLLPSVRAPPPVSIQRTGRQVGLFD